MNKYSLKIIKFINKNINSPEIKDYEMSNKINVKHNLIKTIRKIISNVLNSSQIPFNKEKYNLGKLHEDEFPKMYLFFREYLSTDETISLNSYKEFVNWFILNQHKINYDNIYKKIKLNDKLVNLFNDMLQIGKNREDLHEILHKNPFVGLDTIHYSEITDLDRINIDSEHAEINLFVEKNYDYENILTRIIQIVSIMYNLNKEIIKTKSNKIKLNILLGKQKKYTFNNDMFTPINVNSGSCAVGLFVNIWREEELEKVLFHELQHFYFCDFHFHDNNYDILSSYIKSIFDIDGEDRVNESFNEIMANVLHMIYQSEILKMDIEMIYSYEMYFSIFQMAKIIVFFGGNSFESIFKKNKSSHIVFKQSTSVLSYYIIKTLLLFNINDTLDLLQKFELKCDSNKIGEYKLFLEKIFEDRTISKLVDKIIPIIKDLDSNKFISRTMRMVAIS